jgi:hypothetical protein
MKSNQRKGTEGTRAELAEHRPAGWIRNEKVDVPIEHGRSMQLALVTTRRKVMSPFSSMSVSHSNFFSLHPRRPVHRAGNLLRSFSHSSVKFLRTCVDRASNLS